MSVKFTVQRDHKVNSPSCRMLSSQLMKNIRIITPAKKKKKTRAENVWMEYIYNNLLCVPNLKFGLKTAGDCSSIAFLWTN